MNIQRLRRVTAFFSALALCLVVLSGTSRAADAPAFAHRLPENVAAHIVIPDVGVLRERLSNCSWGRLLKDPLVADFRENLQQQIHTFIAARVHLPEGVSPDDLLNLPTGEITLTVLKPTEGKLPIVLSVDAAQASDTITALVKESVASSVAQGWTQSSIDHAGTTITVLKKVTDPDNDSSDNVRAIFLRDGCFVASNSSATLTQILDRWSGNVQGSFAANETLGRVQKVTLTPGREPALFWYLDPVGATISLLAQGATSDPTAAMVLVKLPEYGLTSFRGVGGTIDFAVGMHDTVTRIAGIVDQPVKSAMAVLHFPATDLTPPAWVSDDIDSCLLFNWDAQSAYGGVAQMADGVLGEGGFAKAIEGLSAKTDPPIHIKKDFIDGLTGHVMLLQGKPRITGDKSGAALLAIGLKDPDKIDGVLRQLIVEPGSKAGSRSVGKTIVAVFDGKRSNRTEVAVARGFLLVGNDGVMIDNVINSVTTEKHLVDSPEYRLLSANVPPQKSLFAFQRPVNQLGAAYSILKQGGVAIPGGVDLKLLPAFDRIQHYFRPTATWAAPTPDGFQYVSFSLQPEESMP